MPERSSLLIESVEFACGVLFSEVVVPPLVFVAMLLAPRVLRLAPQRVVKLQLTKVK